MKRYAMVIMVDFDDSPRTIANEIVSTLEFEHRSTVLSVVALDEDGKKVAVYNRKEKMK